jgi:hypothetical protein
MIKTLEEAHQFVREVKICSIFSAKNSEYDSLWDRVDLPEKKSGEKGWGARMEAVWTWKNQLPAEYPGEIFYGKDEKGVAVLMDLEYLAEEHFPRAYRHVKTLNALAQQIHQRISEEPWETTALRKEILKETGCTKSRFDTALKKLQSTLNIVRLNNAAAERDTWVLFREQYLGIWLRHTSEGSSD